MMKSVWVNPDKKIIVSPTEDTQYVLSLSGNIKSDIDLEVNFEKEGVSCEIIVIGKLKGNAEVKVLTTARHLVSNTSCITYYYASLDDFAASEYTGKIIIAPNSSQTYSYLNNKVLVVGQNTKNISRPVLEIEADDVKASHGATTGTVRKDDLFYLMSRGLDKVEAENTIVEGFFESIVSKIADTEIGERVRTLVQS